MTQLVFSRNINPRTAGGANAAPQGFSGITQWPDRILYALWNNFGAIQCKWNDVEFPDVVQPVMEWRHRKRRWVDYFFSRKLIYLVTNESRSVFHVCGRTQGCFAIFRERRRHHCCPQCHTMLKSNRVEPEIKMADVIPETHIAWSADLEQLPATISNGNLLILESSNTVGLLQILSNVGVTGESKMAAINRKYIHNVLYLSLHVRQQRDSNCYPHIVGVPQHGGTIVNTLRR